VNRQMESTVTCSDLLFFILSGAASICKMIERDNNPDG